MPEVLDVQPGSISHTPSATELLDLFTVALQYLVDGNNPENTPVILRAHRALHASFESGRRYGQECVLRSAGEEADELLNALRRAR